MIDSLCNLDVLYLGDLFQIDGHCKAVPMSPRRLQHLQDVIDSRYSERKATFVTATIGCFGELASTISPWAYDRLLDGAIALEMNWPSWRQEFSWLVDCGAALPTERLTRLEERMESNTHRPESEVNRKNPCFCCIFASLHFVCEKSA